VRHDPNLEESSVFKRSSAWQNQRYVEKNFVRPSEPGYEGSRNFSSNAFSGHERNRMFLQSQKNFTDVTLVSGTDDMADARSFGLLDFNNDGWQDIALMGLNKPRFKLFRNDFAKLNPDNQSLRIKLTGANRSAVASSTASNRDGVGSKVLVKFSSGRQVMLQQQFGEGFASQNSKTLFLGCPKGDSVASIEVSWPSGQTSKVDEPDISERVEIEEPVQGVTINK
jgi:hypothetical protein